MDFSSFDGSTEEYSKGVNKVAHQLLAHGVTAFAPTVITSDPNIYKKVDIFHCFRPYKILKNLRSEASSNFLV